MKSNNSWRIKLSHLLFGAAIVTALVVARGTKAGDDPVHLVTDWSHHHVMFSAPRSLMERFRLSSNPRYVQQWLRRDAEQWDRRDRWRWWWHEPRDPKRMQGDWSVNMGTGATVGAGNYPAKFSFSSTTASCGSDFVVYTTGLAGSATQASIAAFTNLYSSCNGGTYPTINWAYDTGAAGPITTSPVLSTDGTQVAFVQNTATAATLVILRWAASSGTLTSPAGPTAETPAEYNNGSGTLCTAPCMTTITFSAANGAGAALDSFSSPFYDYANDLLYVGDNGGSIHKFLGVFNGTPAELVCTDLSNPLPCSATPGADLWPAAGIGGPMNSPVTGEGESRILVTDRQGYLYSLDPNVGGVFTGSSPASGNFIFSAKLADTGFDDGPLLDVTTDDVYLFAREDNSGTTQAGVIRVPLSSFVDNAAVGSDGITEAVISGATLPATALYIGTFDNTYYTSSGGTGNLYTCGVSGGDAVLYQISISGGIMDTTPALGPTLTSVNAGCSPITEFYNGTTDLMFLSVTASAVTGAPIDCTAGAGCVMSFNITSPTWNSSTATSATTTVASGTSGIVVDNSDSSTVGAEQVYFTPLGSQDCTTTVTGAYPTAVSSGCAIQASQSILGE